MGAFMVRLGIRPWEIDRLTHEQFELCCAVVDQQVKHEAEQERQLNSDT